MYKPMLCKDDVQKFFKKVGDSKVIWEPKLDGVRCLAEVRDGKVKYYSRNGKVFRNFHVFDKELLTLVEVLPAQGVFVFDGEVIDVTGNFSDTMSQVHRLEDVDTSEFQFKVFDFIHPNWALKYRKRALMEAFQYMSKENVRQVPWCYYVGIADPYVLMENLVAAEGYEGIILKNLDSLYEGKKSINWCKLKPFHTLDLCVTGKLIGTGKYKKCLGKLVCDYKGVAVGVGSGFTDAQRVEFWHNPPAIIEVKYQEITKAGSLRFPTFVRVRDDKDETD